MCMDGHRDPETLGRVVPQPASKGHQELDVVEHIPNLYNELDIQVEPLI